MRDASGTARSAYLDAGKLRRAVTEIFAALGLLREAARVVADALVDDDLEGIASHGVMLVPMYVERIRRGSVSLESEGRIVFDRDATAVIDGLHSLGQLTASQAVKLAAAKASAHGLGAVAVRNGFHFGAAGRYALELAGMGHIGPEVRPLYGDPGVPYRCAQFFLAIAVGHFREVDEFRAVVAAAATRVRSSRRAPGVSRVMSPGEPAWRARRDHAERCPVDVGVLERLRQLAIELGVPAELIEPERRREGDAPWGSNRSRASASVNPAGISPMPPRSRRGGSWS